MVQAEDASGIRQQWIDAGGPACDHANLSPEFYLGSRTGDYVCMGCGEEFSRREAQALRQAGESAE